MLVTANKPKSKLCSNTVLFANTEITHFEVLFYFKGHHRIFFDMTTSEAQSDVGYGGILAFGFCAGIVSEIENLSNFAKCFVLAVI